MKTKIYITTILCIFTLSAQANNDIKFSELRFFGSTNTFAKEPTALNNLTAPDNVQKLDSITSIGLEADAKYKWLKVGTKFTYALMSKEPANAPVGGTSSLTVNQYTVGLLARVPVVDTDLFMFDVMAELGMSNNKIDIQTSTSGKGTFTKDGNFYQRAGVSAGIGWQTFKFYAEVGQEWNKLDDLKFEGTLANNVTSADFSGPYVSVGIIILGLPSWIKPGGVTFGK